MTKLTKRENEIVKLVRSGMMNKEIANKLCLTEGTIKQHLVRIFRKLKIKTRYCILMEKS